METGVTQLHTGILAEAEVVAEAKDLRVVLK
jgi:hypothetical protein